MSRTLIKSVSLILIILGALNLTESTSISQYQDDGYTYHSDIETSYKFHNERVDWTTARVRCESEDARLAVTDTLAKVKYINALRPYFVQVWVGIHRRERFELWQDVNDQTLGGGLPWAFLYPVSFHGHCAAVGGAHFAPGLRNRSCGSAKAFACEKPNAAF